MKHAHTALRACAAITTVLAFGAAIRGAAPRTHGVVGAADAPPATSHVPLPALRPDSLATLAARRNPFRSSRSAATVAYRASGEPEEPPAPEPPRPPRPALALAGIMGGADPAALIDGLPGEEGTRVLRVGERSGAYVLQSVGRDQAVVSGPDTVWTLRVRSHSP
jgi:hypothetical protein